MHCAGGTEPGGRGGPPNAFLGNGYPCSFVMPLQPGYRRKMVVKGRRRGHDCQPPQVLVRGSGGYGRISTSLSRSVV